MPDNQEPKELDAHKGGGSYEKELLTEMRREVIFSHVATMPIPLYERIKTRINQFDQVNIWRKQAEDNVYGLAKKLQAQTESLATLESERAMNTELTEQLTDTQQALEIITDVLKRHHNYRLAQEPEYSFGALYIATTRVLNTKKSK